MALPTTVPGATAFRYSDVDRLPVPVERVHPRRVVRDVGRLEYSHRDPWLPAHHRPERSVHQHSAESALSAALSTARRAGVPRSEQLQLSTNRISGADHTPCDDEPSASQCGRRLDDGQADRQAARRLADWPLENDRSHDFVSISMTCPERSERRVADEPDIARPHSTVHQMLRRAGCSRRPRPEHPTVARYEWPCPKTCCTRTSQSSVASTTRDTHSRRSTRLSRGAGWEYVHSSSTTAPGSPTPRSTQTSRPRPSPL
jgi:hypothetical protein